MKWKIRAELPQIFRTACDCRQPRGSPAWRQVRRGIDRAVLGADPRHLAVSLVKFRWGAVVD